MERDGRKEKFPEFDLIRASACIMVITLHVAAIYWYEFSPRWAAANIFDSMFRPCVPLFFMLSGALLLRRAAEENFFSFIIARFSKIVWPLLFWSSFACVRTAYNSAHPLADFLGRLFATHGFYHLWYLYALIGLYALLPIVGKWYVNASRSEILFFLAIWFCVSSASILIDPLNKLTGKNIDVLTLYSVREFASSIGFFVLGAFLFEKARGYFEKLFGASAWLALFALCGFLTAAITQALSNLFCEPYQKFYGSRAPLVIAASAFFFIFALKSKIGERKVFPLVRVVSKYSFGIYCAHAFILNEIDKLYNPKLIAYMTNSWTTAIVIVATSAVVLLFSLAVAFVFKKVPLLRKVV